MRRLAILLIFTTTLFGQRHKQPEEVDAEKPDGKLLQQIMQENDAAKKTGLMEQFATEFAKSESTPWILEQLQGLYVKANNTDKVIATGERLLALDADDPEAALQSLKAAESKKDLAKVLSFAGKTSANARKMANEPQPKEADEVTAWKNAVDYAKQVATYADYALFRVAVESRDPKVVVEFSEALEKQNAQSEYVPKVREATFVAYRQSGQNDKALALAEKMTAANTANEDMLLVVIDSYSQQKKEPEKVHAYAAKIVEMIGAKPKPEGVSDADFAARKNQITGLARYLSGKLYAAENKHVQADTELRAALPMLDAALKPEVNFLLGLANYRMQKAQEAVTFFRACAAAPGPYKAEATKNVARIQQEYRGIK